MVQSKPDHNIVTNVEDVIHSEADALAVNSVEAGTAAAHPEAPLYETVFLTRTRLHIDNATYHLTEFEEVVVLGGGNVASHIASVLKSMLDEVINDGVVVINNPIETAVMRTVRGSHLVPN